MFQVIKREGEVTDFTLTKISDAIMKAFNATDVQYNNDVVDLLALRVTADFQGKVKDDGIHVEDIQDSVEKVLEQAGYAEAAKAFILYRKQREKMRTMTSTILDYKDVVNSYVKIEDWRVKENSTVTYSVGGLILSNSGAVTANYWLSEIYDQEIAQRLEEMFITMLSDNQKAREEDGEGNYHLVYRQEDTPLNSQEFFYEDAYQASYDLEN